MALPQLFAGGDHTDERFIAMRRSADADGFSVDP